jgi:PKD domain
VRYLGWKSFSSLLLLTAIAAGCGSCQQSTPPAETSGQKAVAIQPTMTRPAATLPTAPPLPTIPEREAPPQPAPTMPSPAVKAPAGQQPAEPQADEGQAGEDQEDEADCSVIADADPDFGPPPLAVHFSVDYECTADHATVSWNFGDGSTASGETAPTHTYNQVGDFTARVIVTTPDGLTASDEVDISVEQEDMDEGN